MTTRWAFVPSAPLLAVAGDPLLVTARDAAHGAVSRITDGATMITVLDASGAHTELGEDAGGSLRHLGLDVHAGGPRDELGLGHTIGAWLLDRSGWTGPRRYVSSLAEVPRALLVVADGCACVNDSSPLGFDPRGPKTQAQILDALGHPDPDALAALDPASVHELGCAGAATLAVAGRAAMGRRWRGTVEYDDAPLGIGYWVAAWELLGSSP